MTIRDLQTKYNLTTNDFWQLPQNKNIWIVSHNACEKIAVIEGIDLIDIKVLNSERDFVRMIVTVQKEGWKLMTIGEAMSQNCTSKYYGCIAEKRGFDRAVLKMINAYEYQIYSDSESDNFKKEKE